MGIKNEYDLSALILGLPIIPKFGDDRCSESSRAIPSGIIGSTIIGFGTIDEDQFPAWASPREQAGLVIDYIPRGSRTLRRAALGFTELGIWVQAESDLRDSEKDDPMLAAKTL